MQSTSYPQPLTSGSRKKLFAIGTLSLIGTTLAVYLTYHFYQLRGGATPFHSFCNVSQKMNCDAVAASSYSEVFAGLPLSSFAGGWYLGILMMAILSFSNEWRKEAVRAIAGMSLVGLLGSIGYFLVMVFALKTFCILCLGLDAVNLLLFILAVSLKPICLKTAPLDFSKWKAITAGILGSLFISVLGMTSLDQLPMKASDINDLVQSVLDAPAKEIPMESGDPAIGPASAPIRIVEFSDYQCPPL